MLCVCIPVAQAVHATARLFYEECAFTLRSWTSLGLLFCSYLINSDPIDWSHVSEVNQILTHFSVIWSWEFGSCWSQMQIMINTWSQQVSNVHKVLVSLFPIVFWVGVFWPKFSKKKKEWWRHFFSWTGLLILQYPVYLNSRIILVCASWKECS